MEVLCKMRAECRGIGWGDGARASRSIPGGQHSSSDLETAVIVGSVMCVLAILHQQLICPFHIILSVITFASATSLISSKTRPDTPSLTHNQNMCYDGYV